jgi:hypothetical protein
MEMLQSQKSYRTMTNLRVMMTKGQDDEQLFNTKLYLEMARGSTFFLLRHGYSKQLPPSDCMWDQNDKQETSDFLT